jgi:hypothetical protein
VMQLAASRSTSLVPQYFRRQNPGGIPRRV